MSTDVNASIEFESNEGARVGNDKNIRFAKEKNLSASDRCLAEEQVDEKQYLTTRLKLA